MQGTVSGKELGILHLRMESSFWTERRKQCKGVLGSRLQAEHMPEDVALETVNVTNTLLLTMRLADLTQIAKFLKQKGFHLRSLHMYVYIWHRCTCMLRGFFLLNLEPPCVLSFDPSPTTLFQLLKPSDCPSNHLPLKPSCMSFVQECPSCFQGLQGNASGAEP